MPSLENRLVLVCRTIALAGLLAVVLGPAAEAQYTTWLEKPPQKFFFYQVNLAAGYDSQELDAFGFADRGPRTQLNVEWLSKDPERIQRGYTRLASRSQWNLKLGLELDPAESAGEEPTLNLRLFDAWVQLATRWDRTSFWLGHRSLPYGFNPRLDPGLSPLPSQASLDLGFSRDLGVFFRTPLSPRFDLDLAATAGGCLDRPLAAASDDDGSLRLEDRVAYRDSWLVTARLGRSRFEAREWGFFAAIGDVHRPTGPLTETLRLGFDWVSKHREDWTIVHQLSTGEDRGDGRGERLVGNLLNSFEVYLRPRWRAGATHTYRYEDFDPAFGPREERGTIFATVSYALDRDTRLRLNPYAEYHDSTGERDAGLLVQLCTGCGWRK